MHLNGRTVDGRFKDDLDRHLVLPAVALRFSSDCESSCYSCGPSWDGLYYTNVRAATYNTDRI